MGTLKYAILGMLNQRDRTGYELMKEFEDGLVEFWPAKHSQIYPELKRLTEEGMVTYQVEISGTVLEKKLYTITELGRQTFLAWLRERHKMPPTPKDPFRLQVFFSHDLTPPERMALLTDQLEQHRARLAGLRRNQEKFDRLPARDTAEFSDYLVLMGAIMREETSCAWLERCISLCTEDN